MRAVLCEVLRAEGHLVAPAASEEKALVILGLLKTVGLILLAWKHPGTRGEKFLTELRSRQQFAATPVIALTMDMQVFPAGVQGCLRKPYLTPKVLELARHYCGSPHDPVRDS